MSSRSPYPIRACTASPSAARTGPEIAWYGDMDLVPHFVRLAGLGAIDVAVSFGEPIPFGPQSDRKAVAEQCFAAVRACSSTRRGGRRH